MFSLFIDKRVRLYGNRKAHVMKALFKKIRQHVEKKNEKYALKANKRWKKDCLWTKRLSLDAYAQREVYWTENQSWCLEEMVHSDSLKESMPTKWIKVSIMLSLYSKKIIFLCLM